MATLPFGEWLPDQADLRNPGVLVALNVFPNASGYIPARDFVPLTDALLTRPREAITARNDVLTVFQYVGDDAMLSENIDNVWTDRSIAGGYNTAPNERWSFIAWKNKILGTNWNDKPQQITMGDVQFSELTDLFNSRDLAAVGDFVVHFNTLDATDGAVPSRVRWSAFNDETDYVVSPVTLSGFADLKNAPILRGFGGEFGVILQTDSVWRMSFIGQPAVFQFDEVLPGIGLIAPGAATRDGDSVYFLSPQGFIRLVNGVQVVKIGSQKVDRTVLDDLDTNNLNRISCTVDQESQRVFWLYPGSGNTDGLPNKLAIYDTVLDRWSLQGLEAELIWRGSTIGTSLDSITTSIDDIPGSLDSNAFVGGNPQLGAFDSDFKSGVFTGDKLTGVIITGEMEIYDMQRAMVDAFRPLIDGGTITAMVGERDRQVDDVSFGPVLNQSDSGRFTTRANARFHRFRFDLSDDWDTAFGMQLDPVEARKAGRRG